MIGWRCIVIFAKLNATVLAEESTPCFWKFWN
jgi:hypothetical protein